MIVLLCEQHWGAGFHDTLQDIRTITDFCFFNKTVFTEKLNKMRILPTTLILTPQLQHFESQPSGAEIGTRG